MRTNGREERHASAGDEATAGLLLSVPEDLVEAIAERAAELVTERNPGEDGWLRGAQRIAAYVDCPPSRIYALVSAGRIPVHHDGSALVARRSELDRWLLEGGGLRP
jgi:hypothetical protein